MSFSTANASHLSMLIPSHGVIPREIRLIWRPTSPPALTSRTCRQSMHVSLPKPSSRNTSRMCRLRGANSSRSNTQLPWSRQLVASLNARNCAGTNGPPSRSSKLEPRCQEISHDAGLLVSQGVDRVQPCGLLRRIKAEEKAYGSAEQEGNNNRSG